jgi:hypothetical protein
MEDTAVYMTYLQDTIMVIQPTTIRQARHTLHMHNTKNYIFYKISRKHIENERKSSKYENQFKYFHTILDYDDNDNGNFYEYIRGIGQNNQTCTL